MVFLNYYPQAKAWGNCQNINMMGLFNYPVNYGGDLRNNKNIRGFNPFLEWTL